MAIDSQAKRMSAKPRFGPAILADGTISTADRPAALRRYIGITITALPGGVAVSPKREDRRLVRTATLASFAFFLVLVL